MVEFTYDDHPRRVEPYSLRRAGTGNILLYAWDDSSAQIKAFNTARLVNLRATTTPFVPRFRVEFTASGPLSAQPLPSRPSNSSGFEGTPR